MRRGGRVIAQVVGGRRPMVHRPPSAYHAMWLFALFDLPMLSKAEKRAYVRFRKHLIESGFAQLQYSVYAQYCASEEASVAKRRQVRSVLPSDGQVRLVSVTDKQFAAMEVFLGKTPDQPEQPPGQLLLF